MGQGAEKAAMQRPDARNGGLRWETVDLRPGHETQLIAVGFAPDNSEFVGIRDGRAAKRTSEERDVRRNDEGGVLCPD